MFSGLGCRVLESRVEWPQLQIRGYMGPKITIIHVPLKHTKEPRRYIV